MQVLVLIEHTKGGSRALLMERRTGALMGDVSMEDYGPCAICALPPPATRAKASTGSRCCGC